MSEKEEAIGVKRIFVWLSGIILFFILLYAINRVLSIGS